MFACARIGAIHSVVFGGFAANELAVRLSDAAPKVIVTATCGIEVNKVIEYMPIVNEAIELSDKKSRPPLSFLKDRRHSLLPSTDATSFGRI